LTAWTLLYHGPARFHHPFNDREGNRLPRLRCTCESAIDRTGQHFYNSNSLILENFYRVRNDFVSQVCDAYVT
jgi:hypothetical protein